MKLEEFKEQIQNLDLQDVGNWPVPIKSVVIAILCVLVLALCYWFDTKDQLNDLGDGQKKEQDLKADFEQKQHKAANLVVYREQMEEMQRSFGTMLRQLPSKNEIAELLVDISQTGLTNGLEFQLFKPEAEVPAEFYAVLPIKMKVSGTYHQLGNFVSDVAVLPRIVTLHDIVITPVKNGQDSLVMEVTAKTYRYLEEGAKGGTKDGTKEGAKQ